MQEEILDINSEARDRSLQVALLVPDARERCRRGQRLPHAPPARHLPGQLPPKASTSADTATTVETSVGLLAGRLVEGGESLVESGADLVGVVRSASGDAAARPRSRYRPRSRRSRPDRSTSSVSIARLRTLPTMAPAIDQHRSDRRPRSTGDVWLFRGRSGADRAIRVFTNSPVNHVAMVVALDDLPPLLWHTELGQSIESVWSGDRHRGAQLNRLDEALAVWTGKYKQLAFVRQLRRRDHAEMEDSVARGSSPSTRAVRSRGTRHLVGEVAVGAAASRGVRAGRLLRRAARDHLHPDGSARRRARRPTGSIPAGSGAAIGSSSPAAPSLGPEIAVTVAD